MYDWLDASCGKAENTQQCAGGPKFAGLTSTLQSFINVQVLRERAQKQRKMPLLHIKNRVLFFFCDGLWLWIPGLFVLFGRQEPQHKLYHYVVETGAS
jgi:hypothetical protein